MAGNVNKVILVGHLGKDPETKNFDNGGKITEFSVATSESYKDSKSGEKVTQTEWHRLVIRKPALAGIAEQYLRKGMLVYVEGKIRSRTYQTKENETRNITEIIVDDFTMLSGKNGESESTSSADVNRVDMAHVSASVDDKMPF